MYTQTSTYIHIRGNIMFPLLYCEVTVGSSKQVLTGTTPLNQSLKILSILSNFYTRNDGKTRNEAIRRIV